MVRWNRRFGRFIVKPGRRGAIIVKAALLMPVLIGMMGLVVDVGLLLAASRQVQNAADAAAKAAAMDVVRGKTIEEARTTADTFIRQYNGLGNAPALVSGSTFNNPPSSGAYAGETSFIEVIVTQPVQTLFIQVLGVDPGRFVRARAVAGFRPVAAGEGVIVLDRNARPGLRTSNNTTLRVNGRITVNSEGGGVDEHGQTVPGHQTGASAGTGGIWGTRINVVGGVNDQTRFQQIIEGEPPPLRARSLPEPDPLINLPTPTVSNGVDPTMRGSVNVGNNSATFTGNPGNMNFRVPSNGSAVQVAGGLYTVQPGQTALFPGIYDDISISGGDVIMVPGIYVIRPSKATGQNEGLSITGGVLQARGVMIYSTGHNYDPYTGLPDANDRNQDPPAGDGANFGVISFTAAVTLQPISTSTYAYGSMYTGAKNVSEEFDGMLFYQRRRNTNRVSITGNSSEGRLGGTIYGKWTEFRISGQGAYDAQFIVGSMDLTGQGNVTILAAGSPQRGKANQVFLVE